MVAVLLADSAINDVRLLPWVPALGTAAVAFVGSIVLPVFRKFSVASFANDLVVRLGRTFVVTFLGALGIYSVGDIFALDWTAVQTNAWPATNVAILAVIGALAKGMLARQETADGGNPSTLPAHTYQQALEVPAADGAMSPEPPTGLDPTSAHAAGKAETGSQ